MYPATEIDAAIAILTARITKLTTPDEALKFTQAALNLSHTKITLSSVPARG